MDKLIGLRDSVKANALSSYGVKITYMPFFLKVIDKKMVLKKKIILLHSYILFACVRKREKEREKRERKRETERDRERDPLQWTMRLRER
jgi:hypothetical protein